MRLRGKGIVGRTEEVAKARIRYQFLIGPTSCREFKERLSRERTGQCWRHKPSERRQAFILLKNLKERLSKVFKDVWKARKAAAVGLTLAGLTAWRRHIAETTKAIRHKESKGL